MRRLPDIDEIDLVDACFADTDNSAFHDTPERFLARIRCHLLGVVEPFWDPLAIKDHGGCDHRARERPAAGFVDARDRPIESLQYPRLEDVMGHCPALGPASES